MEGFFKPSEIRSSRPGGDIAPKCGACGLYKTCKSPKIKPWGSGRLKVLIVGEAPGETEDEEGKPFVGASGEFLRDAVREAGGTFSDLLITNSVICRPPGNKIPQNGKEVGYCRPNLLRVLETFKPRVVIPLGRHALDSVLRDDWKSDLGNLERWVGRKIPLEKFWVCPTWHPSFLLRETNPSAKSLRNRTFVWHLKAAFEIGHFPPRVPNFKSLIELLTDDGEIVRALRAFDESGGLVAFDYEGNCLKPEYPKSKLYSCAVSDGKRTVAFPWRGRAPDAVSIFLRSRKTGKIASNLKFEERWTLRKLGHGVANWAWDTMLAAHALDNRAAVCSLKFQAFVQLGVPTYNEHIEPYFHSGEHSHYNRIAEIEPGELLLYNGMDALLEWILAEKQMVELKTADNPIETE